MIVSIALGVLIHILSTALTNFIAIAIGLEGLYLAEDKKTYVVMVTLALTIIIGIFSLFKKAYDDENTANLIYSGFSLVHTFLYNMNSYSFLLFISFNNSSEKLSKYYPIETVDELLNYYSKIELSDLVLLIAEMICGFFILKTLFCTVCKRKAQIFDYMTFIIGLFVLFYSQYCIDNKLIVFTVYLILLIVGYGKKYRLKKDK